MVFAKNIKHVNLKLILILAIVIIFCAILAIFFWYRSTSEHPEKLLALLPDDANISIDRVHQESIKNGIKEWSLNASSADYFEEDKSVKLKDVFVTFFLKDGDKVVLKADQGILRTDSNDIEVSGNVIITNKNYKLLTKKIFYDHKRRVIFSKTHVKITGDHFDLEAEAMFHDLNTNKASLEGMVTGVLSDKITF
jgi:LPS export ABC transporter protein LptC